MTASSALTAELRINEGHEKPVRQRNVTRVNFKMFPKLISSISGGAKRGPTRPRPEASPWKQRPELPCLEKLRQSLLLGS
jgi:hypothetical protein